MERKSDGATDGQSNGAKSDGATERRSDGATERRSEGATERAWISLYIKIEKIKNKNINCVGRYGWSERATEQRATERRSNRSIER